MIVSYIYLHDQASPALNRFHVYHTACGRQAKPRAGEAVRRRGQGSPCAWWVRRRPSSGGRAAG